MQYCNLAFNNFQFPNNEGCELVHLSVHLLQKAEGIRFTLISFNSASDINQSRSFVSNIESEENTTFSKWIIVYFLTILLKTRRKRFFYPVFKINKCTGSYVLILKYMTPVNDCLLMKYEPCRYSSSACSFLMSLHRILNLETGLILYMC